MSISAQNGAKQQHSVNKPQTPEHGRDSPNPHTELPKPPLSAQNGAETVQKRD